MKIRALAAALAMALFGALLPACGIVGGCAPTASAAESVPRLWVEAALDGVRRDFPAPTVHARNLWHLSAVMWDAWAAYQPGTQTYFEVDVDPADVDDQDAVEEAVNYAAHRLLSERYEFAIGGAESLLQFDQLLDDQCLDLPAGRTAKPGSAAAVGLAIADAAIEFGANDGASEITRYINLDYQPFNDPLVVGSNETSMKDPNRWQPLQLADRITQNGQSLGAGTQVFIGSHWGKVTSFALPPADDEFLTIDPGPPPRFDADDPDASGTFVDAAIEVIAYSDTLGGELGEEIIDISPGAQGNNTVGTNDGSGWPQNPSTGERYAPNEVSRADFGRAVAEFWADGPDSETPPGHWNTLAIQASDGLDELRWEGSGELLERFEWDLRLFFVLNASLHDAAVATWGSKRAPGLVATVTEASAASGGRFSGVEVGTTMVRSWAGPPKDAETDTAGVGWRAARFWLPYQRPTFVSPAFAGYVSGHSAFSRAAAEVLTNATGTEFFPGGMLTHSIEAGAFLHEEGPSVDMELQWATYFDAADEAGEARRYGGIHVAADDFAGRLLGQQVAELTWTKAQQYLG